MAATDQHGDLIHQTTTTTGTGAKTLVAVNGKRDFSDEFGTSGGTDQFDVFMQHRTAAEFEHSLCHLTTANNLVVDNVVASSNADAAVSFSAGTIDCTNDVPGANAVNTHLAQTIAGQKTFVAPVLGTVAAGSILTNATGLPTGGLVDAAVTYAKMQNVVNDERILGRVSGADGDVEELTVAQVLTALNVEAGADVTDATNVNAAGATMNSDLGTGVETWLGTPTVANLSSALDVNLSGNNTGDEAAASTTVAGVMETAIASEINTGTDAARAVSPDSLAGSNYGSAIVPMVIFDNGTDCATGDAAGDVIFVIPEELDAFDILDVGVGVFTAGTTGTMDVQIHNIDNATDMLGTLVTLGSGATYVSDGVVHGTAGNRVVNTGDRIRVDVDGIHTTAAKGLFVNIHFRLP